MKFLTTLKLLKFVTVLLSMVVMNGHAQTGSADKTTVSHAIFAGGCFWCMEEAFEQLPGVIEVVSGYSNGHEKNPDYQSVTKGNTGHYEVVRVDFNANEISYETLVDNFWLNIDPTDNNGQFCDKGPQYKSGIFYQNDKQQAIALNSLEELKKTNRFEQIHTVIEPAGIFYEAETYHQNYYKNNPFRYKFYKTSCGRSNRLNEIWGE